MAYKFQSLAATMSGSLTQEGDFTVKNDAGTTGFSATAAGAVSGSGALSAGGNLQTAGTVKFTGVADTAIAVASDALYFKDADGSMKSDSVADLMTAAAGAGLAASSGVLAVDIDELSAGTTLHQTEDHFMYSDNGTEKKITFSDVQDSIFADIAGDVTIAAGGASTIGADAVEGSMLNDNVISGQTELAQGSLAAADEFLLSDGGAIKRYGVDSFAKDALALTTEAAIADGDYITFLDGGATGETKKESLSDLATLFAGDGLSAASSVLSVAVSGAVKLDGDKIGVSGSFAGAGLAYLGGVNSIEAIELDLNELVAAAVDVSADSIAIVDANDANVTKKESIADLMTAAAGAGLAAASGVLSVDIDELSAATTLHQTEDHFIFSDNGTEKKITFSDVQDSIFADVSGDATIAAGGALTIAAQAVENSMLADDAVGADELAANAVVTASIVDNAVTLAKMAGITRGSIISGDASGDPAALAVGSAHQFLQSDGTDLAYVSMSGDATLAAGVLSIGATKVTDAMLNDDVASGLAGAGLSAASGVLSVTGNNVALKADGNALAEGYNYFADASSNAAVTMPANPSVGDVVTAKAGNLTSNAVITINKGSADHRIDGLEGIVLESPFASVTMVYVVADAWRIV